MGIQQSASTSTSPRCTMLRSLVDLVYPRTCLECVRLLERAETDLCPDCRSRIRRVDPTSSQMRRAIENLSLGGVISDLVCLYAYTDDSPVRSVIHALKYRGMPSVGIRFGQELGATLRVLGICADLVVPIPLSVRRKRERGFNQASRIAEGVAKVTGIPVAERLVVRTRESASQTGLPPEARRQNVLDSFEAIRGAERRLARRKCLLIDDVITTGSTVLECASTLRRAGAQEVLACAVALACEQDTYKEGVREPHGLNT